MGWKKVDTQPEPGMNISHGICRKCFDIQMTKLEGMEGVDQKNIDQIHV